MNSPKTARITIIALAAAAMLTSLIAISSIELASAAKSGRSTQYCYTSLGFQVPERCFNNMGDCNKNQTRDQLATSGCYRQVTFH
jgi:hypothetical protein